MEYTTIGSVVRKIKINIRKLFYENNIKNNYNKTISQINGKVAKRFEKIINECTTINVYTNTNSYAKRKCNKDVREHNKGIQYLEGTGIIYAFP